jgi:hypothetical protein
MKRTYIQPTVEVLEAELSYLVMTSTLGVIDDYDENNMTDLARENSFEDDF